MRILSSFSDHAKPLSHLGTARSMASNKRLPSLPIGYSPDKALASLRKSGPRSCSALIGTRVCAVSQRQSLRKLSGQESALSLDGGEDVFSSRFHGGGRPDTGRTYSRPELHHNCIMDYSKRIPAQVSKTLRTRAFSGNSRPIFASNLRRTCAIDRPQHAFDVQFAKLPESVIIIRPTSLRKRPDCVRNCGGIA